MYRFRSDDWGPIVPPEIQSAWASAPGGWRVALSIPVDYVDQAQGRPWRVFRLNIAVCHRGAGGGPLTMTSWQLDWKKFSGPISRLPNHGTPNNPERFTPDNSEIDTSFCV